MNMRNVDLQVNLQRTPEINRLTNNDGSRAQNQNAQLASAFQKALKEEGEQVTDLNKSENPNIKKDGRNKRDRDRRRQDSDEDTDEQKAQIRDLGMLDIRI